MFSRPAHCKRSPCVGSAREKRKPYSFTVYGHELFLPFFTREKNFVINLNIKPTKVYRFAIKLIYVVMSQVLHVCILYGDDDYDDGHPGPRSSIPLAKVMHRLRELQ